MFSDYISHILPELGEENIREMSFDLFAYKELHSIVNDCEDRYDELEHQMQFPDAAAKKQYELKQSPEIYRNDGGISWHFWKKSWLI